MKNEELGMKKIKTTEGTELHGVLVRKSSLLRVTPWLKFFRIALWDDKEKCL
jgi:hypothetical protein